MRQTQKHIPTEFKIVFLLLSVFLYGSSAADILFSAPPREKSEKSELMYEPVAKYLSEKLGERVVYVQPKNWAAYSRDMRNNRYDIIFDGPHFAAWRIKHLNHVPVAKLPLNLRFVLVANNSDQKIKHIQDLMNEDICGMPSPNLGTMLVYKMYDNPVMLPNMYSVKGGMNNVLSNFLAGKCKAAILRDLFYNKLPENQKQKLRIIATTESLPDQTITVSERLNGKAQKIAGLLVSKEGAAASGKLFEAYSKKAKYFLPTKIQEYNGMEKLLEGVVWGW